MGKYYKVNIKTPNLFIIHKKRQLRTPLTIKVSESEIELIKMKIKQIGTPDYSIEEYYEEKTTIPKIEFKDEIIVYESLDSLKKPSSILNTLLDEK